MQNFSAILSMSRYENFIIIVYSNCYIVWSPDPSEDWAAKAALWAQQRAVQEQYQQQHKQFQEQQQQIHAKPPQPSGDLNCSGHLQVFKKSYFWFWAFKALKKS